MAEIGQFRSSPHLINPMSYESSFIPGTRKGAHYIKAGGRGTSLAELQAALEITQATFMQIHGADGALTSGPPAMLTGLLAVAQAGPADFRVILLTPGNAAFPGRNVYADLVADELATRTVGNHQPVHPTPPELKARLLADLARSLDPGDFVHRQPEIAAALAEAGTGPAAESIAAFAEAVERYRDGEIDDPYLPIAAHYGTQPEALRLQDENLGIFIIDPPQMDGGLPPELEEELPVLPEMVEPDEHAEVEAVQASFDFDQDP
ncbi:MAG: hypothetical protein WC869_14275 [Phycisphaerae bacterium]